MSYQAAVDALGKMSRVMKAFEDAEIVLKALAGVDSLYSIVQMPKGYPVASMAIGAAGATTRAKFNLLGQAKEDGRVMEFTISNAVMEAGTGNDMVVRPPVLHAWPAPTVARTRPP